MLFLLEHIGVNQLFKLLNLIDFGERFCHGIETEAVVGLEIDVGFHGGKITQYLRIFSVSTENFVPLPR